MDIPWKPPWVYSLIFFSPKKWTKSTKQQKCPQGSIQQILNLKHGILETKSYLLVDWTSILFFFFTCFKQTKKPPDPQTKIVGFPIWNLAAIGIVGCSWRAQKSSTFKLRGSTAPSSLNTFGETTTWVLNQK